MTDFPPPPEPDPSRPEPHDTQVERFLTFDVERLAAPRRVQLRRAGGVTEPLTVAQACLERGVSLPTLQSVFDAICVLCQRSATRVFCRVSAAQVAAVDAALSVTKVNRCVPLLASFGLIVRRARHRGPWESTVPALVDAAAAPEGTLAELWDQPTVEAGPPDWQVPATVAEAAAWVRMPEAALEAQPTRSCPCRPRCDLGDIIEQLVAVVGPQVRSSDWQQELHEALAAGYSAQYILWELTRDMHSARTVGAVSRSRLHAMLGRPKPKHRHACSDADQYAAAVSWHCQALAARKADWQAAEAVPGPSREALVAERPGFALERKHHQAAKQRRSAESAKPTAAAATQAITPKPHADSDVLEVAAEYRETNRKELLDAPSPPQTPPLPPSSPSLTEEPAANSDDEPPPWAFAVIDEAAAIKSVEPSAKMRRRLASEVAAQHDFHDEQARLAAVLGLVSGTQSVRWPLRVMAWRATHRGEAERYAGPMLALVAAGLGGSIRDPDAWQAAHNSANRRAAARLAREQESQRRAEELAQAGERSTVVPAERAEDDAGDHERRAADVNEAAESLLGRSLHPAIGRLTALASGSSLLLAMRRAARVLRDVSGLEAEIAAVLVAAGRWADLQSALGELPAAAVDPGIVARVAEAATELQARLTPGPTPLQDSDIGLADAASRLGPEALAAFVARVDIEELPRSALGAAITALASNPLLSPEQRRSWAARLLGDGQSTTDT